MQRKRCPLAAVALLAVISGCGSAAPGGAGGATATANGGGTGAHLAATKQEKAERFAECMREHGVPHFPDPDASGEFNFGVDVTAAVFTRAVGACKSLQPPGSLSSQRSAAQQSAALSFAACVRAHGVPDFPDPVNGQPLIDTNLIPSTNQPGGMTILNAATHACGARLGAAAWAGGGQGG